MFGGQLVDGKLMSRVFFNGAAPIAVHYRSALPLSSPTVQAVMLKGINLKAWKTDSKIVRREKRTMWPETDISAVGGVGAGQPRDAALQQVSARLSGLWGSLTPNKHLLNPEKSITLPSLSVNTQPPQLHRDKAGE